MSTKNQYTAEDKAKALTMTVMNDGNELRTSQELGIPLATLRYWRKQEREGNTSKIVLQMKQHLVSKEFADVAARLRIKAMVRLEEMLDDPKAKFNPQQLATTVGILTDKLDRINTMTLTHTTESSSDDTDESKIAASLTSFLNENSEAASERRDVIEADLAAEQSDEELSPEKEQ